MDSNVKNIDNFLVTSFFALFLLLTFYYIGIRSDFFQKITDKLLNFCFPARKPAHRFQVVTPELISAKYNRLSDFLTGRDKFESFNNSISLFLTNVTPATFIGVPTSVYLQGAHNFVTILCFPIATTFVNATFLPVFYNLKVKTINQYIGKRFNFTVKTLCLTLTIWTNLIRMGIWLNAPNLNLTNFTLISKEAGLFLTISIVVIYTSLGGMEVMQKMERFQLCIMIFSLMSVVTKGITEVGGINKVYEENLKHGRLNLDFDINPFTNKQTFWTVFIGNTFVWCSTYALQQSALNRYLNAGSLKIAKRIMYTQVPLMTIFFFAICFIGLLVYTFYFRCDPLITNRISHLESLIGLFSFDITSDRSGLLGLFIVAIYAITLSSISSSLNGLSTILFEDVLKFYGLQIDSNLFIRGATCAFGIMIVFIMLFAQQFTQSLRLRIMIYNTLSGPLLGLFLLGFHSRRVNSTCGLIALIGGLLYAFAVFFIHFKDSDLYLSFGIGIEDCVDFFCYKHSEKCKLDAKNQTISYNDTELRKHSFKKPIAFDIDLFQHLTYTFDGWMIVIVTILIGLLMSLFFNSPDHDPEEIEQCLAPYMQRKISSQVDLITNKPELETLHETTTYVIEEDEKKDEKEDGKDEQTVLKDAKEIENKDSSNAKKINAEIEAIDVNYLRKAIDELFTNSDE